MIDFDDALEDEYGVLPEMELPFTITNAEWETSKKGDSYLKLEFTAIGDHFAGRKVWLNYNFFNQNPTAVGIAKGEYLNLAKVFGYDKDSLKGSTKENLIERVLGKQVVANVRIKKGDGIFKDSNTLKGFSKYESKLDTGDVPF